MSSDSLPTDNASAWLRSILTAPVYDVAERTPLDTAQRLSQRLDENILLKREDEQPVFSFKIRGAYTRLARLSDADRRCGVLAISAGNHAQGVAMGAKRLGLDATIVMPATTPKIKIQAVEALGAKAVLHGDSLDEATTRAMEILAQEGRTLIHPFDDADVIAGQGTVAMELMAQHQGHLDAVFVPVGGGGLSAGIATYIKTLDPSIKVIAVEPNDAACLKAALAAGKPVPLDHVGIFVDGCAVRQIGALPFSLLRTRIDEVVTVEADQVCAAIRDIFEDTRSIVEPAGALAVAGLKQWCADNPGSGRTLAAVLSGANMNFDRLGYVSDRAEIGELNEALFGVSIPEKRGSYLDLIRTIGHRAVTEFNYRYHSPEDAQIYLGVKLKDGANDRERLLQNLIDAGYPTQDYTDNEVARLHLRYLIGGPAPLRRERVFRFEFPERPGALLHFLETLGMRWNISLFHYRNHGAADGRVLCGFEVAPEDDANFDASLEKLGYWHYEETRNAALIQFGLSSGH